MSTKQAWIIINNSFPTVIPTLIQPHSLFYTFICTTGLIYSAILFLTPRVCPLWLLFWLRINRTAKPCITTLRRLNAIQFLVMEKPIKAFKCSHLTLWLKQLCSGQEKKSIMQSFWLTFSRVQRCVKVGGKCNLHCGGLGEYVNTGCQPPLHDCPGKRDRAVGSVNGNRGGTREREIIHKPPTVYH